MGIKAHRCIDLRKSTLTNEKDGKFRSTYMPTMVYALDTVEKTYDDF